MTVDEQIEALARSLECLVGALIDRERRPAERLREWGDQERRSAERLRAWAERECVPDEGLAASDRRFREVMDSIRALACRAGLEHRG